MSNVSQNLFVYGTLRRAAPPNPMQQLLAEHSQWLGEATVEATLHAVGAYTAITLPGPNPIRGEVFAVDPAQWDAVIARLDAYEGPDYRLQLVDVALAGGDTVAAWAYTLAVDRETGSEITP